MQILGNTLKAVTVKEIGKFTILWGNFEKEQNYNCNSDKIWDFANKKNINLNNIKNLSKVLNGRVDLLDNYVYGYVNYNLVPDGAIVPSKKDLSAIQGFINFNGENLLAGALLAIYRIRNNLLYGLKLLTELNNQIELFKAINKVLEKIM